MAAKPQAQTTRSQWGIRGIVAIVILMAVVVAAAVSVPREGKSQTPTLPSVALGQESVYRMEIFLLVFYGGLLVATPAYWGLIGGRLPTEISARGAKFAEEAAASIEETVKLVDELQDRVKATQANLARSRLNIDQLAEEVKVTLRD